MKELKMLESVYSEKFDINIKPYLTIPEIETIIQEMSERGTYMEREMVKNLLILRYCTDIEGLDEGINSDTYDLYLHRGVFKEVYRHIDNEYFELIENGVKFGDSFNMIAKDFLDILEKNLDKLTKKIKPKEIQEFFKKAQSVLNKELS